MKTSRSQIVYERAHLSNVLCDIKREKIWRTICTNCFRTQILKLDWMKKKNFCFVLRAYKKWKKNWIKPKVLWIFRNFVVCVFYFRTLTFSNENRKIIPVRKWIKRKWRVSLQFVCEICENPWIGKWQESFIRRKKKQ